MAARNWLVGCGIGCGAVVLLCVSLVVGFLVWVTRPGELLEPERLLGPSTAGYVEWTLRLEDPGTQGFVEGALLRLREIQRRADDPLPGWLRRVREMQEQRDIRKLRGMFPLVAVWTLQPENDPGQELQQLSFSFEKLGNRVVFFDWLLAIMLSGDPDARIHEHAGENIYQLPLGPERRLTLFIRGNDLFFCSDLAGAIRAVDRVRETASKGADPTLAGMLAAVPADGGLRGAIVNDDGGERFDRLLGVLPGAGWSRVRGLTLHGGLQADGSFRATIELLGRDRSWASAHADTVADHVRDRLGERLDVDVNARPVSERVVIVVVVADVLGVLDEAAQRP